MCEAVAVVPLSGLEEVRLGSLHVDDCRGGEREVGTAFAKNRLPVVVMLCGSVDKGSQAKIEERRRTDCFEGQRARSEDDDHDDHDGLDKPTLRLSSPLTPSQAQARHCPSAFASQVGTPSQAQARHSDRSLGVAQDLFVRPLSAHADPVLRQRPSPCRL